MVFSSEALSPHFGTCTREIARELLVDISLHLGVVDAATLLAVRVEAILDAHLLHLFVREIWQKFGRLDIADVLGVSLGENNINLFQRASGSLGVENPDDWNETCVDDGEEKICAPFDVGDHDGSDHDNEEIEEPV